MYVLEDCLAAPQIYMQKRKKNVRLWESLFLCTHTLAHTHLQDMLARKWLAKSGNIAL